MFVWPWWKSKKINYTRFSCVTKLLVLSGVKSFRWSHFINFIRFISEWTRIRKIIIIVQLDPWSIRSETKGNVPLCIIESYLILNTHWLHSINVWISCFIFHQLSSSARAEGKKCILKKRICLYKKSLNVIHFGVWWYADKLII